MSMTTIGVAIYDEIENDEYLNELYDNILYNYGLKLFNLSNIPPREYNAKDAMRFADILSKSVDPEKIEIHKLWA